MEADTGRINRQIQTTNSLNVRKILLLIWRSKYIYLLAILLSGGGAYYYLQKKIPTYQVETTVLIGEGEPRPGEELLQGFAIRPGLQNLDNQMVIISSFNMINKTLAELPFEIDIYTKGFRSQASYYPRIPFRILPGEDGLPKGVEFAFEYIAGQKFHLTSSPKSSILLDTILDFGQEIELELGSFTIFPQPGEEAVYKSREKIYFNFFTKNYLTASYVRRLNVVPATRDGGIVKLSLVGPDWVKDIIFLNKLAEVFINDNLDKKNLEANRIIEFIDRQLGSYSDSLKITENQLQEFRSSNRIMDVSVQAEQIVDQALQLENEKARLTLESNYYQYLEDYLSKEGNENAPIAPASMGISDLQLTGLMQELLAAQAEYFGSGVGDRNPLQGQLEIRMKNTKKNIRETLTGIMLANQMALDENERQINNVNKEASRLPVKERQLLGFERKFNLNNVMYTFLLQERAEAQIQRASNTSDHELVDQARSMGLVSPNRTVIYLFAFAFAFGLPTIIILFKDMMDDSITSEEDLNLITQLPVLARIPQARLNYNTVVLNEPNSIISEAYRSLRSRMEFIVGETNCPLILITSSISGEGKTFSAINLASAYHLAGKKTLLIGFDLRRPTLSKSFELNSEEGLSSYLIGKKSLEEVIFQSDFPNLHIIPSGPIPPNPGELASSQRAKDMFTILKEKYDFIIVDCPPIGVVSDIYPIAGIADSVLLMVRHGLTKKNMLSNTIEEVHNQGIHNLNLLVNDVKLRGNSYQYAYKYKYQSSLVKNGVGKSKRKR